MAVDWSGPNLKIGKEGTLVTVLAATLAQSAPETAIEASARLKAMVDGEFSEHEVFFSEDRTRVRVAPKGHTPPVGWDVPSIDLEAVLPGET